MKKKINLQKCSLSAICPCECNDIGMKLFKGRKEMFYLQFIREPMQ